MGRVTPSNWGTLPLAPPDGRPRLFPLHDRMLDDTGAPVPVDQGGGGPDRPRHLRATLDAVDRPAAAARRAVIEHCRGRVPETILHDLCIIVSELVANVLEHGGGSEQLSLDVTVRPAVVDVMVVGRGDQRRIPPPHEWRLPPPWRTSGRGLPIVRRLSSSIAIDGDEPIRDRSGWVAVTASVPLTRP